MKVAINVCFGGFSLSPEAELRLYAMGCKALDVMPVDKYFPPEKREDDSIIGYKRAITEWRAYLAGESVRPMLLTTFSPDEKFVLNGRYIERNDPMLIQVIEEMGAAANGACAELHVVEIPDGTDYEIDEYDGNEHIAEKHRTWR